jgi:UDP-N-acetylglucosamine 1-carboxyvinyltransferase
VPGSTCGQTMADGAYSYGALVPDVVDVVGGHELSGTVQTGGFKHSLVTCVAAACLGSAPIQIDNCPGITETAVLGRLLRRLGAGVIFSGSSMTVDPAGLTSGDLDPEDAAAIHGSVYLAPSLLARFGAVQMPASGGCRIGPGSGARPVSHYLSVLSRFGADTRLIDGLGFRASATRLRAAEIDLLDYTSDRSIKTGPLYSGATKFAILAAASSRGTSVLRNPYPKPDVRDLVALLEAMGADIQTLPDDTLIITGGLDRLCRPVTFSLSPDLIEVMTWLAAGIAHSPAGIVICGRGMHRSLAALAPELAVLRTMGVETGPADDTSITVRRHRDLRPADVLVASHSVFSDSQPFLVLLACLAQGTSRITETVWPGRLSYVAELRRLGAPVRQDGHVLTIEGASAPKVACLDLRAGDLRAAAALILAALHVDGPSAIHGARHLARGYADLPGQLRALGADVSPRNRDLTMAQEGGEVP